jgi:hypothetical protein
MKKDDTLGQPIPIRLWKVDEAEIQKIAAALQMPVQEVIRRIVAAGAQAIKENDYIVEIPLSFALAKPERRKPRGDPSPPPKPAHYPEHNPQSSVIEDTPRKKPRK